MATPIDETDAATITRVEPAVTETEPERFAQASAIADRFLDNLETVVYGKRDEIQLVLTAMICGGHVLLATENPIEYEGTFPLPEAQLDRFFLRTALGYPGVDDELRILEQQRFAHPLETLRPIVNLDDVEEVRLAAQYV